METYRAIEKDAIANVHNQAMREDDEQGEPKDYLFKVINSVKAMDSRRSLRGDRGVSDPAAQSARHQSQGHFALRHLTRGTVSIVQN